MSPSEPPNPQLSEPEAPISAVESVRQWLRFETAWLTAAFWGAVGLLAIAFLACPYPPMIDYPQHVAMGSLLHDLFSNEPYATALYRPTLFTYNAGIETAIALLSFLVSPELAGRIILAAHAVSFAGAALALCDYASRPRWYALLAIPWVYNHITGWGFSNFVVALPLALLAAVLWMRVVDGSPSRWRVVGIVVLSMLVAYTHVLVMLSLCVLVAVVSLDVLLSRGQEGVVSRVRRLLLPAAVLVPPVGYSMGAWYYARATSTTVWEHSWAEGQDDPLWSKLRHILYNSTGNFADGSDQYLVAFAFVLGAVLWLLATTPGHDRMRRLALVFFGLYAVIPKVFIATFHIYQRFLPFAALFAIAAIPVSRGEASRVVSMVAAGLALVVGGNTLYRFVTIPEVEDAMAIIDDAPVGKSLVGVKYDVHAATFNREIWVHHPSLYQVRKKGVLAYSFLRNESVPVHYLPGKEPPRPPGGFEWNGQLFDVRADYARAYDLVLVRSWTAPSGRTVDPAPYVFKEYQGDVRLLSRRGSFFLYDMTALNDRLEH